MECNKIIKLLKASKCKCSYTMTDNILCSVCSEIQQIMASVATNNKASETWGRRRRLLKILKKKDIDIILNKINNTGFSVPLS